MKKHFSLFSLGLVTLCSCNSAVSNAFHKLPEFDKIMNLSSDIVSRTAALSLDKLSRYITDSSKEDTVFSPASLLLAAGGLSAVSDNFDNSAFGLVDAQNDVKTLLESWNFKIKERSVYHAEDTYFKSCVLHQQVGEKYAFDREKQQKVSEEYISTMVSNIDTYANDAQKFFDKKLDINLKVPNIDIDPNSVLTYSALTMKDTVINGLEVADKPFNYKSGVSNTKVYPFGSESWPKHMEYYRGENYYVFKRYVNITELMIILPDVNVDVNTINVKEAYENYYSNNVSGTAYGYIPYFHNKTLSADITDSIEQNLTGSEILYSKLLKDDVINDLSISGVFQSNDFEFSKYGVSGSSITVIPGAGATGPGQEVPVNLSCDRPFYAISLMDDFPMFINKVNNPGK